MDVKEQIKNILERATQDFDGRDEIMKSALNRIVSLENELTSERKRCASIAYKVCAETRHVSLGEKASSEIMGDKVNVSQQIKRP